VLLFFLMLKLQSFSRMWMVFLTAPLALIGVVPALLIFNGAFGFVALCGVIALSGIIMRDAVIRVDQIDTDIAAGAPALTAVVVGVTRRHDKTPVCIDRGNAGVAVPAYSAVAGLLSPVGIENFESEDGDELLPPAVRAARQAGATYVIAVDATSRPESAPLDASQFKLQRVASRRACIAPEAVIADCP
jgi:hypothetical protein